MEDVPIKPFLGTSQITPLIIPNQSYPYGAILGHKLDNTTSVSGSCRCKWEKLDPNMAKLKGRKQFQTTFQKIVAGQRYVRNVEICKQNKQEFKLKISFPLGAFKKSSILISIGIANQRLKNDKNNCIDLPSIKKYEHKNKLSFTQT